MQNYIDILNSKWKYKRENGDNWKILDLSKDVVQGDCEDYSLTVLYYEECNKSLFKLIKSLLTKKAKIHFVKTSDIGHAVLEIEGKGFIDNYSKKYVSKRYMVDEFEHRFIKRFWTPVILLKMLKGYIFK